MTGLIRSRDSYLATATQAVLQFSGSLIVLQFPDGFPVDCKYERRSAASEILAQSTIFILCP